MQCIYAAQWLDRTLLGYYPSLLRKSYSFLSFVSCMQVLCLFLWHPCKIPSSIQKKCFNKLTLSVHVPHDACKKQKYAKRVSSKLHSKPYTIQEALSMFKQIYIYIRKKRLLISSVQSSRIALYIPVNFAAVQWVRPPNEPISHRPEATTTTKTTRPESRRSKSIIRVSHKHPCHLLPRSLALVTLIDDLSCLAIAAALLSAGKCMHVRGDTMSLDFKFCGEWSFLSSLPSSNRSN